jgi:hypothetical protein
MQMSQRRSTNYASRVSGYVIKHRVSLGLFLAAYGVFYLSVVIMSGWTIFDLGANISTYPPFTINSILPRSFIAPIFFFTSIPALLVGASMLSVYCIRGLSALTVENRERIAIILTCFGFAYVVIGAWPLGNIINFPWEWQKQIAGYGTVFTWSLYILSLVVLAVGSLSVYRCSKIFHEQHPEFSQEN